MRYFTQSFDYDHSWSKVVIGMWHKYPNPHCTHVLSVDVVDRSVDPQTGVIRTERILGCKQRAPTWIVKLFGGSEDAFVREISFVDPSTQTATISSVNLSLAQFAVCNEFIRYAPAPPSLPSSSSSSLLSSTSLQRTRFEQTAEIESRVGLWHSVADRLESWLATRFEQNAQNGKLGFSDVLRTLWEDRAGKSPELQCHHS